MLPQPTGGMRWIGYFGRAVSWWALQSDTSSAFSLDGSFLMKRLIGVARRMLCAILILWLCGLSSASIVNAAPIDSIFIRAICKKETRHLEEDRRDAAKGDGGESWGRCQVKIATAAFLLGIPEPSKDQREVLRLALQDELIAHRFVELMILKCRRQGYRSKAGAAWCFNRGWNSGRMNPKDEYVQDVLRIDKELRQRTLARR